MFIPILASVGYRGLPWTMGNPLHIYCWGAEDNVFGRGAGSRSPRANICLKLEFSALFTPILASVGFRQLPRASVDFRGKWNRISTYIVGVQTTKYVGGVSEAKVSEPIFT